MPVLEVCCTLPASAFEAFDRFHDYASRLSWDTLLQQADLDPPHAPVGVGSVAVCRGRGLLGLFTLRTRYVTFDRPRRAAVTLLNRPALFHRFAASVRHRDLAPGVSQICYKVNFAVRPAWLTPLVRVLLRWETARRLRALRSSFQIQPAAPKFI